MNLLKDLNPAQREAVTQTLNCNTLVIAGAGSGKTTVVTRRLAYLLQQGVRPENILAITFTNKAAKEIIERVNKLISEEAASKVWLGTFHGICVKILHRYGKEIGLPSEFVIYDTGDSNKVVSKMMSQCGVQDLTVKYIRSRISYYKNNMITPEILTISTQDDTEKDICRVYEAYQEELKNSSAVDFDDLLLKVVRLLHISEKAREYYQNRFHYIFCDEYQDSNPVQDELIKILVGSNNNLMCVGDDCQSIFGFRSATIANILNFQKNYPGSKMIKLEENYRSSETIVEAGNSLIKFNLNQIPKELFTNNLFGSIIKYHRAQDEKNEARWLAGQICELHKYKNIPYKDMVVLYRTHMIGRMLELGLVDARIPYQVISNKGFYDRKEIKDVINFLRLINNPLDRAAFNRIISLQSGLGPKVISNIIKISGDSDIDLIAAAEVYKSKLKSKSKVLNSLDNLLSLVSNCQSAPIVKMINGFLIANEYSADLDLEAIGRITTLKKLAEADLSLQEFLEDIALSSDQDSITGADKVKLMTVHAAKGLEFPIVFLTGMDESFFPISGAMWTDEEIQEERRLCYVAITRAKKELYISSARNRRFGKFFQPTIQSRFIKEIPQELIMEV